MTILHKKYILQNEINQSTEVFVVGYQEELVRSLSSNIKSDLGTLFDYFSNIALPCDVNKVFLFEVTVM